MQSQHREGIQLSFVRPRGRTNESTRRDHNTNRYVDQLRPLSFKFSATQGTQGFDYDYDYEYDYD